MNHVQRLHDRFINPIEEIKSLKDMLLSRTNHNKSSKRKHANIDTDDDNINEIEPSTKRQKISEENQCQRIQIQQTNDNEDQDIDIDHNVTFQSVPQRNNCEHTRNMKNRNEEDVKDESEGMNGFVVNFYTLYCAMCTVFICVEIISEKSKQFGPNKI